MNAPSAEVDSSPPRFDDLDATLSDAWRRLAAALTDRDSPFRTPVLATLTRDGVPSARVVVLRAFDPARRVLEIHTDVRSRKVPELETRPHASLLFYDASAQIQLRVMVQVTLHCGDAVARRAWQSTSALNRHNYRAEPAPDSPLAVPGSGLPEGIAIP